MCCLFAVLGLIHSADDQSNKCIIRAQVVSIHPPFENFPHPMDPQKAREKIPNRSYMPIIGDRKEEVSSTVRVVPRRISLHPSRASTAAGSIGGLLFSDG